MTAPQTGLNRPNGKPLSRLKRMSGLVHSSFARWGVKPVPAGLDWQQVYPSTAIMAAPSCPMTLNRFFVIPSWLLALAASAQMPAPPAPASTRLPSTLIDGRFYLKIPTLSGDTMLGFCDTGGGYTAIYPTTINRLKLHNQIAQVSIEGRAFNYIRARDIYTEGPIPFPQVNPYYQTYLSTAFFEVSDDPDSKAFVRYVPHDVFLGQFFFINHAWTFDYRAGTISLNAGLSANPTNENVLELSFKKDRSGHKRNGHPRLRIRVEGRPIDVLFDTGASLLLSEGGKTHLGTSKPSVGGSFITKTIFDQWHQRYPDWRVIEGGELTGADLIEVPQVQVGNLVAGPVWFAKRADQVWSKAMMGSMDRAVQGAIGGSFLQYFTVQIDYNRELIKFEK